MDGQIFLRTSLEDLNLDSYALYHSWRFQCISHPSDWILYFWRIYIPLNLSRSDYFSFPAQTRPPRSRPCCPAGRPVRSSCQTRRQRPSSGKRFDRDVAAAQDVSAWHNIYRQPMSVQVLKPTQDFLIVKLLTKGWGMGSPESSWSPVKTYLLVLRDGAPTKKAFCSGVSLTL